MQERFDRARRRQVEEHAVLVLFDLSRDFEECKDDGGGLGGGQGRMGQGVRAQGLVEDRGGTSQEEPHSIGQERCCRRPVAVEVTLDRLDTVFTIPPRAGEVRIHPLRRRRRSGRDDKARSVPRGHDVGFDDHAPRLGPRGGGRAELLIQATAGGRALAIGLREGGPLLVEAAGLLHDGGRVAEQHGMARHTEDEIAPTSLGAHVENLWGGKVAVTADQDRSLGPVAPQIGQEPDEDHGVLGACGTLAWPEAGGHQGVCSTFENEQRQIAIALVVMVIEGKFLLAMSRVIGVIEVKHNGGGGLGGAGDEVVDQGVRESVEILTVDPVFKPGKGRGTRHVLRRLQRGPLHAALQQGGVPEALGIIAIRVPQSDLVDTLSQEVPERVIYLGLMSLVLHSGGKAFGEANLAIDAPQQEGAKVG